MTQELKNCPYCGASEENFALSVSRSQRFAEPGDAETGKVANLEAGYVDADLYVECHDCAACGPPQETEAEAITAWNTRAPFATIPDPEAFMEAARGMREALEELVGRLHSAGEAPYAIVRDWERQADAAIATFDATLGEQ